MARLGNVFNNKEDIKKEEQHPRRMIKWIHYNKIKRKSLSHLLEIGRNCAYPVENT